MLFHVLVSQVPTQYAHTIRRAFQYTAKINGYNLGTYKLQFTGTPKRITQSPT